MHGGGGAKPPFHGRGYKQIEHTPDNKSVRWADPIILYMSSKDRHELRYWRRRGARERKRAARAAEIANIEKSMSFGKMLRWGWACCSGTAWKSSTQSFRLGIISSTARQHNAVMQGKINSKGFICFDRMERGKLRHIKSVHITERQIRKTFNQEIAVPLIRPHLIYDNHASLKGRGTDRALNRLNCHLDRYFRKHGNKGYILIFDFTDYFGSVQHDEVYRIYNEYIRDPRAIQLGTQIMELNGPVGFGLGCEMSQTCCVAIPNRLDHFIKQDLGVKGYGRYMDDGYVLEPDLERIKVIMAAIIEKCHQLGIQINERKTKILPVKSFTWLKTRFILTDTGKIIRKMSRKSITTQQRKLKKFKAWVELGHNPKYPNKPFTLEKARASYISWRGHKERGNCHKVLKRMDRYFTNLFGVPPKEGVKLCIKSSKTRK